jgi:uncharacterized protein (TIGR02466 family)
MNIHKKTLFPTSVWQVSLPEDVKGDMDQKLIQKVLSTRNDPTAMSSPQKKWYTPRNLHETAEFEDFNKFVLRASRACLDDMRIRYKDIEITGCWGNISSPGATHHRHSHPNNYLSVVYYLQADEGANTITFHDPRPVVGLIRPPRHEPTHETAETINLIVNPGDLVIFPHWLVHSVEANTSERERISIACNIMFSNYMSEMVKPMW